MSNKAPAGLIALSPSNLINITAVTTRIIRPTTFDHTDNNRQSYHIREPYPGSFFSLLSPESCSFPTVGVAGDEHVAGRDRMYPGCSTRLPAVKTVQRAGGVLPVYPPRYTPRYHHDQH